MVATNNKKMVTLNRTVNTKIDIGNSIIDAVQLVQDLKMDAVHQSLQLQGVSGDI